MALTVYQDTYANIPGSANANDLFFSTDGPQWYIWDGSAWVPYGGSDWKLTHPTLGDFAWLNQGSASSHQTYGPIYLESYLNDAAANLRGMIKAAPSTPYTITALVDLATICAGNVTWGLLFYEQSSGKLIQHCRLQNNDDDYMAIRQWTNVTTFSSAPSAEPFFHSYPTWLRVTDDGTNLEFDFSVNGQDWVQLYTQLRGAFFTTAPSHVGFGYNNGNNADIGAMVLLSWVR